MSPALVAATAAAMAAAMAAAGAGTAFSAAIDEALGAALGTTLAGWLALWLAAIPAAALLLGLIAAAALAAAALEWALWRGAKRAGLPVIPAGSLWDWIAGLGGLPHADSTRGEPQGVAFGFATVVGGVLLAAGVVARAATGVRFPAGFGAVALFPLACALGYAVTAERARTLDAARHRAAVASRILLAAPAWVLAVALWARFGGAGGPDLGGAVGGGPPWRVVSAAALVWSGLFVLPGAVAETGLAARAWGGDAREESGAVRLLTGAAHYAGLAVVCLLGGAAFAGGFAGRGLAGGVALAAAVALVLRVAATLPWVGPWVRGGPSWAVPALLLFALWAARGTGAV
jgi:hypothetical protein